MKPLYVISDTHVGAVRSGGTTPHSAWQLRLETLKGFEQLLDRCDSDLLINGDWLDTSNISQFDLLETFKLTSRWLERGHHLYASRGNHDASKNDTQLSSFDFLVKLLHSLHPEQVTPILTSAKITDEVYVVPHVATQEMFDVALSQVPAGTRYCMLHANYNSPFAAHSDMSLNVSEAQAAMLPVEHLVFAHEHQQRAALDGKVIVVGNQFCTSISDALGNSSKRMLKITDDGLEFIETWRADGDYVELDWRDLKDTGARFIRAVGTASAAESAQVVTAVSKFRAKSSALIVGNAVKVEGVSDAATLELSLEQITAFNVREALREMLTDDENTKIDKLREHNA